MQSDFDTLAKREDVPATCKGLMLVLRSFIRKRQCRPTREQLLKRAAMSSNALYARLAELRALRLLNMHETRDKKGRIRTMFILFPPLPQGATPCRKKWGKVLVAEIDTRDFDFTHARVRVNHTEPEASTNNGKRQRNGAEHHPSP